MSANNHNLTGYGPRSRLLFDGDERNYETWEVRFLGYLHLNGLKSTILTSASGTPDAAKNEKAYSELVQVLDERSLSLIMRDATDDGATALRILREHYCGQGKPRILTLYTELTTLIKSSDESMTDYVIRAERAATGLKNAGENVSDSLLIAMVLKGLPDSCKSFVVVITQSDKQLTFSQFKTSLRNFSDTESSRSTNQSNASSTDSVMKTDHKNTLKCFCVQERRTFQ